MSHNDFDISVRHIAYASVDRRITITSARSDTIIIEMQSALFPSKEVIIRSTRTALCERPLRRVVGGINIKIREITDESVRPAFARKASLFVGLDWETKGKTA